MNRPPLNEDRLRAVMDQAIAGARGEVRIDDTMWICVPSHLWAQLVFEVNPPKPVGRS